MISDIKQAFLQIQIDTEHRDFLRFLWYNDVRTDFLPSVIRFTRLVFGLTSSPFILNTTVKFHLSQYLGQEKLKCVIEKFLHDLYVDDSTASFDDVDDAYYFYQTAKSCLQKESFDLRKWITKNENLQHRINEHEIDYKPTNDYHKVLGLNWDYKNDEFIFEFSQIILEANKLAPTKRSVLKITGMFFDPLGLILPIIIQSKLIFKKYALPNFHGTVYYQRSVVSREFIINGVS